MSVRKSVVVCAGLITAPAGLTVSSLAHAQGVISAWNQVQAPPPPALQALTVDPAKTALLVMDFGQANCSNEPRCKADIPHVKALLDQARSHSALIIYTGFPGLTVMADIARRQGEAMVVGHADKFYNTNLDEILKQHGITTLIACGTAANGAELFTAFGAAARGYHVIVPVDCMPGRSAYAEQSVVWGMANDPGLAPPRGFAGGGRSNRLGGTRGVNGPPGAAVGIARRPGPQSGYATLTSSDMIHFG